MTTNEKKLKYLQKVLGLTDWKIILQDNCTPYDMANIDRIGECEWEEVPKVATIRIIDEKHYGERPLPFDYDKTLIHELLHIKFAMIDGVSRLHSRLVHQLIEEFARILGKALKNMLKEIENGKRN